MNNINKIIIKMYSSDEIFNLSNGEVLNSETINYKTHKPEINGLFCERIFGPIKDYKCYCGKYDNKIYKNIICNICGVEITKKNVRRKRIGHIELIIPIVHIWNFKILPNKISYLTSLNSKKIESIIYYDKYIILKKGSLKNIKKYALISEKDYINILNKYRFFKKKINFIIKTGGEAILYLLKKLNINKLYNKIKNKIILEKSFQKKKKLIKKIKIIKLFQKGIKLGNKIDNIIVKVLPVIPPDLRPIVFLENNKFASSDLNNFYKKIIIRNNRLKKMIKIKAPNIIVKNEKRLLQESVDILFDNSKDKNIYINKNFKSLSDFLKGKQGRFRQNLLGKRVDYSARSVIVVNPKLKLYECKIPINVALELYKPFIIRKLFKINNIKNIRLIKYLIKKKKKRILNILKDIIITHPLLLNRAPTLHRLSMQSFYPKLTYKKVIEIPPLVCAGFNADFDGDQMAIHLPLSHKSILETKILMLSIYNILNISNGEPILVPSQDMLLGLYYITKRNYYNKKYINILFSSFKEVKIAYNNNIINIHDNIKIKIDKNVIYTTTGRILFNNLLPHNIKFINKTLKKNILKIIIKKIYIKNDIKIIVKFLDNIKKLGFYYAYKAGLSFGIDNIKTPKKKYYIVKKSIKYTNNIIKNYNKGLLNKEEKYNKIINIWNNSTIKISNIIINNIKKKNKGYDSLYMMLNSGARGTKEQIKQISGIRGLISKPQKSSSYINIIETPIVSNFLEGMSILEYFISTHGSRKGLADTALKTADAGYLTRRLVDSSQNVIIDKYDCNTKNGIFIKKINKQIIGKFILTNIIIKNKYIIKNNNIITYNIYNKIKKYNIKNIYIRSILKCELYNNICVKCYGLNLSTNKLVRLGEAVGVIAAQSIGEPGTQLTLKTFHIGGTIKKINKKNKIFSKYNGYIKYYNLKLINHNIIISKNSYYIIYNKKKKKINKKRLLYGYKIYLNNNSIIKIGDKICSWDNYNNYIYSEYKGYIKYNNFRKNLNYYEVINKNTGYKNKIISKIKNKNNIPYLLIINKKKQLLKKYYLYEGNYILNNNKKKINIGDKLINIPKFTLKVNDITGGLPKLSNIFEMKKIKNKSKISEISGVINYDRINNNSRIIKVISNVGIIKSYKIKLYNKLLIQENEYIKYGDKITNGNISLNDILYIKGINKLKNKLIKKLQNIYITQGVYINDKHFEIIIKQMLKFVLIINVGNTNLVINNIINKYKFYKKNNKIKKKSIIINSGDSKKFKKNDIIFTKYIKFENFILKIKKKKIIKYIKCKPAIGKLIIKGISLSALKNNSFISSASFQETNKILNKASIGYTTDNLLGLKENVIIGNLIPSGTGYKKKII